MSHENIMRLWSDCSKDGVVRPALGIVAKTASYTMTPADFGKVFTTRGSTGAVTFTLPTVQSSYKGEWALFVNVADQNMFVAGTDEELVIFNDLTADSIGFATSSEKIAGALLAMCDGTSWIVLPIATETQTISVGSAASTSPSASVSSSPSAT